MSNKSIFMGVFLAMLTATSVSAYAADTGLGNRLFRFDFRCDFSHHHHDHDLTSGTTTTEIPGHDHDGDDLHGCDANARVFAYVRDDDRGNPIQTGIATDQLAVACHGHLIYADGAILDSTFQRVVIAAANGVADPAIILPRFDDHQTYSTEWMEHRAFLLVGGDLLEGSCKVSAHPAK